MSDNSVCCEYRIREEVERPSQDNFKEFSKNTHAKISASFRKRQALPMEIKPVWDSGKRIVGTAITVSATPGDEILALKAIEIAQPGDVIVVAMSGESSNAFWGGVMSTMAKVRGVEAL